MDGDFESSVESGRAAAIALDFPASDSPSKVPRRIRQRLLEKSTPATSPTIEEIEAKLKEADLRRQQFHEWLSNKARPKPKSLSWSSQEEELARLEAKLSAAEQKRLNILAKAQLRLAKLDEMRNTAKNEAEMRFEKEREELGTKVESRVHQAELNRMLLLNAYLQRRAAARERSTRSLLQRMVLEKKYKECVYDAICQKRAAAEKKRLGFLEAEKRRAHARVMRARRVAKSVCQQREIERRKMIDRLEDRLQRAKRQRAEYLRQRGGLYGSVRINYGKMHVHGDHLSRKLARCWRRFLRSRKTTFDLAKAYVSLEINENSVKSMPFDHLAVLIESAASLQTVKALMDRLETRLTLLQAKPMSLNNIDTLLKHLATPAKSVRSNSGTRGRGIKKGLSPNKDVKSLETTKLLRYPTRVVLCAYMILGHPDAVFSGKGEREIALAESAVNFIREFELLVNIILYGTSHGNSPSSSWSSSPDVMFSSSLGDQESAPCRQTFRSQLAKFDAAWCSYLYQFVVWKIKDARSLEDDLVRAACQLELSMMQTCKLTARGDNIDLTHDMKAIKKQVSEDQRLLREKVLHLSGNAGIERMDCALLDTRSKYFESREKNSLTPVARISPTPSSLDNLGSVSDTEKLAEKNASSKRVVRSLFKDDVSTHRVGTNIPGNVDGELGSTVQDMLINENEFLVNEIVHGAQQTFVGNPDTEHEQKNIKAKIKETIERAFWDGIAESLEKDEPDCSRIIQLVKEVRDELWEMAPQSLKQEIHDSIDIDILSQVLKAESHDMDYLGSILEYALATLQKLSAPANEDDMKRNHSNLLNELSEIAQANDKLNSVFVTGVVKGLRFVLEQIQALKREISKARILLMEPLIKGPAGFDYLQNAFVDHYGHPSDAPRSLPRTCQWLKSLKTDSEREWTEHMDFLSALPGRSTSFSQGLPPATSLRAGGSIPIAGNREPSISLNAASGSDERRECQGDKVDVMVRLGFLKLVSAIEGIIPENLPETLKLNFLRLRNIQGELQKIAVVAASTLVLRQMLISENLAANAMEIEHIIADSAKRVLELLEHAVDAGISEIVETAIGALPSSGNGDDHVGNLQSRKGMMANMLSKSLQAGDPVFSKVARAIYLAGRAMVLCGGSSSTSGWELAEQALRRVGAAVLSKQVAAAADPLVLVATVSVRIHGPWYSCLIENI